MRKILTTAAVAAIGLTTLIAPAASAGDMGARAVGCEPDKHVRIQVQKRGNFIDGLGGFFGCDMPNTPYFTIAVQRKRFIGWYDEVPRSGNWPRNQYTTTVYTCTGQGKKTYRTLMTGTLGSGKPWSRTSSQNTVTC